jgi:alpha-tubulin suppressor-like RCC1 family protein
MGNGGNAGSTTPVAVSDSTLGTGEKSASLSVGSMANHVVFTTAIPSEASLAGLTALSLGSGTLSPAFSSNIEAYTASVPNATNSITITATALNADVGLTVNGIPVISGTASPAIPLVEGPNVITVIATSPDGATVKSHTVTVTRGFILNATIASAISVPVTASGYTAASSVVNLSLGYAPATGATLTVINNTGPAFISGQFTNLAHLQTISLTYGNITYKFIANYYGGTGNDLVLQWASNKTYAWGNNFRGQLGNNSLTNSRVPVAVTSGALSGKTIIRLASCSGHSLALCSDGTLAAWGYNLSGQLGDNSTSDSLVPIAARTTGVLAGKTIISIAAGESHSLVLCSDGTLAAWGSNNSGQLGIGNSSTSNSIVPVAVATNGALAGKTATAIAAGSAHNLALCSDGTLVAWGAGNNGQLGNGGADSKNTPFEVTRSGALAGKTVTSIAAGVAHSFALCSDGTLVSWGFNDHGQLGNNSTVNSLVPVAINSFGVLSGKSVTAICAGGYHGLALRSDGVIASWGYNNSGQLGINSTTDSRLPVTVIATGALAGRTIKSIAGGDYHSLVHCTDGTMAGWGQNYAGQLGNNTLVNSGVPVLVSTSTLSTGEKFMSLAPSSTSAHSLAAVAVPLPSATGMAASNVRGTSATLIGRVNAIGNAVAVSFEYGLNTNYGKTITAVPASVAGFNNIVVSAGIGGLSPATTYHFRTVAACTGGTVRSADMTFTTLGDNAKLASLGLGTGALAPTFETLTTRYVATVPFTTDGVTVTPATEHPGAKVKVNGATVASGVASGRIELTVGNNLIQILVTAEDGETTRIYQIAVTRLPQEFVFDAASDIPVTAEGFAAGDFPAVVRLGYVPAPGTLLTMVNNTGLEFIHGRFGNLAQGQRIALNHADTTYDFVVNYFGGSGNDLVLQWADTKVMAWGSNSYGQLGDNSTTVRLSPVAVNESGALSGRTIVAVSGGYLHSLALCSDGTLAAWGYNVYGQLGDNGNAASPVPVAVDGSGVLAGRTVVAIATGPFHNLALCADGRVAAWGYNNHGQLGTGDKANLRAAGLVEPVGALSGKQVVAVAAGAYHSFALCSDGTLAAWGYNDEGELGDGTNAGSLTPVAVDLSGRRVVSISAGQYHTLALCTDGSLLAWGYNNRGQLGNGRILASNIPLDIGNFGALSGKSISAIAAGGSHSLALLTDGTLAAWGYNHRGQLGATGVTQSTTPIAIADSNILVGRTIAGIVTGGNHNLVRCTDDTLAAWGDNANGQLGNKLTVTGPLPGLVDTGAMVAGARPMFGASGAAASHNLVVIGLPTGSSSAPGQIHFANSAAGADLEDPDQDGISNLLEYAFGLDPNENSAGQLPQPKRVGDHYVLGFTQPDGVTGITYSAEWSATLQQGSWTIVPDSGIGADHVFSVPAGMEPKIFMRLKVVTQK